jgi:hypothetical protein
MVPADEIPLGRSNSAATRAYGISHFCLRQQFAKKIRTTDACQGNSEPEPH